MSGSLRIAVAVGLPLLLAGAAGYLLFAPAPDPVVAPPAPETPRGAAPRRFGVDESGRPIPPSEWPRVEGPAPSLSPTDWNRPVPTADDAEPLTNELLDLLLAEGTNEAWFRIRDLMQKGPVPDPAGVAERIVEALGKGGPGALHAVQALALVKDEDLRRRTAASLLALAGTTTDDQTLKAAFQAAGQIGDGTIVADLGRFASTLSNQSAATGAVRAIARIGTPESARELARLLAEKQGSDFEAVIAGAIGEVRTPAMAAELIPLTRDESPPGLRVSAVRALGMTRTAEAVPVLADLAAGDGDRELRETALAGLGQVGSASAVERLLAIRKSGGDLWFAAGISLGQGAASADAARVLLTAIDDEPDPRIRASMARALEGSAAAGVGEKMASLLSSAEQPEVVRVQAARTLGRSGDSASVAPLTKALERSSPDERGFRTSLLTSMLQLAAAETTRKAMQEKALPVLKAIAESPADENERYWALRTIRVLEAP